ncbi:copper resistance CopC family protein [Curtobacterium herbarum]|uniref:CopC domain-containing protein n=1 Tax=Curtobacterium herbarum TaxID=150122 RepID=A0ABP4K3P5_9MICO|nr:copper resistance CopC family protein [Curtobacterium herbarum]MBM7475640.1 methionine-rich copper-binding protein CopC [Curtobacterium herbarum]MCS6543553.1 copper resistance protein CopC [Curtobacterium herbarum]
MSSTARSSHTRTTPTLRRTLGSLVGVATVLAGLATAAPASAHSGLTGSTPAEGAVVSSDLRQVDLTFTEAPLAGLDAGLRIEVRDQAGQDESTGEVTVAGTTMSKQVDLSAGPHTMLWRYVSPDGHPIDGQVAFTVQGAPSAAAEPTGTPTATPSREARGSSGTSVTTTPTPAAAADRADGTSADASPSALPWVIGGVALVVVLGVVVVLASRRRSAPAAD